MIASRAMMAGRPSPSAAGALICGAIGLWVSGGALSFVSPDPSGPYLGILPPVSRLVALLASAIVTAVVVRPSPRDVAPLWLSLVLVLPWLPIRLPLSVFIWTGALAWWLWAAIALALLAPFMRKNPVLAGIGRASAARSALLAGGLSLAAFAIAAWWVAPQHPGGDEPHYLVITQSLLEDGDLRIENNHRNGRYRAYFQRDLKPDYLRPGSDGQIYSVHAPGLSALVAPFYLASGYPGVVAGLVALAAAGGALAWLIAWLVTRDAAASWFGWAAVALTVPFFFHSGAVFPDGPAAAFLLAALLPLVHPTCRSAGALALAGAALAALPWMHTRFVMLAIPAAIVIVGRVLTDRWRPAVRIAAFAACPVVSAAAWFLFFQAIYGTPSPSAPYAGATLTTPANMVRGVPGLLFDQQFGLLANAPVYLCAFAGLVAMLRHGQRRLALELLFVTLPYCAVVASFFMWWAGSSAPARFLVPVTLVLVVPTSVWFAGSRSVAARALGLGALVVSLLMTSTIAAIGHGAYVFNFRDGISRLALWVSPVVDLTRGLPSLFQSPPSLVWQQALVWTAAVAAAVAAGLMLNRFGRAVVVVGSGLTLQLGILAAVSFVWTSHQAAVVTPGSSGPALLRTYDADQAQLALTYRPLGLLSAADLPGRVVLAQTLPLTPGAEWSGMTNLPPGAYEIAGVIAGRGGGRIRITTDPRSPPIADWDVEALPTNWRRALLVPAPVAALYVEPDAAAKAVVRNLSVRAVSVWPDRSGGGIARYSARYGRAGVFLIDGTAWLEPAGTWIGGSRSATFQIAAETGASLPLLIRNGPVANRATLRSAQWREELSLGPGEVRTVDVPVAQGAGSIRLDVSSAGGFRPPDFDAGSQDVRFLGVWMEVR
jgi:hypothetical protein